jgi:hypothetical protein
MKTRFTAPQNPIRKQNTTHVSFAPGCLETHRNCLDHPNSMLICKNFPSQFLSD